ncbi:MAG: hypothetical protein QOF82_115, partial [Frankiales bacterium]|nr:hypothetical protein [Frankiales bacterium]
MSGTELSRLMAEVTAQPPLDVDFATVAGQVARRDKRRRRTAAGAAVLAVAVIVGVPTVYGTSGQDKRVQSMPPASLPVVSVDATWRHDSWGTLTWRTPGDWLPSAAYPDHGRPSNTDVEGPYIGNARLPVTSPSPRPLRGSGVLGSAGPQLPPDAVVAWFSYGQRSVRVLSDGPPFDDTTPPGLQQQCAQLGAGRIFHAVRQFGTQAHGSNLALDGCISAADPAKYEGKLLAVLASAADSAYPPINLGTPQASAAATGMVGASWAAGGLSWQMPRPWLQTSKTVPGDVKLGGSEVNGPFLSTMPLNPTCLTVLKVVDCAGGQSVARLGNNDLLAEVAVEPFSDGEGDTGQFYPPDDDGTVSPADVACRQIGGGWSYSWSHMYGPRSKASIVRIWACLGNAADSSGVADLKAVGDSMVDHGYPDLAAGSVHPTLVPTKATSTPGRAAGTTADALCTSAHGPVASAELTT